MNINACIVIPCYNEEKRLIILKNQYYSFIEEHDDILLCFVNDGSTDGTLKQLEIYKAQFKDRIEVVASIENVGKAEAIRKGVLHCNRTYNHKYIAYLDADLSTSLNECSRLISYLEEHKELSFVFASRMLKIGSVIERQKHRFLIGRIIATMISRVLDIKTYDTQCGCKIFTKYISHALFEEKFISKWLFDVELFFRMIHYYGKEKAIKKMIEIPLELWVDKGESKVKYSYFFQLWIDLYKIRSRYSN
jgi:glycosyltransferase involved in cell wall biosynthesis